MYHPCSPEAKLDRIERRREHIRTVSIYGEVWDMVEERALQLAPPPGHSSLIVHRCFPTFLDIFASYLSILPIYARTHPPTENPTSSLAPPPPTSKRLGPQCGCGEHPLAPSQPSLLLRQLFISHSHPGCSLFLTLILLQARMLSTPSCSSSRTWPPSTRQPSSSAEQIRTKRYPHSPKKDLSVRNTGYVAGEPGH